MTLTSRIQSVWQRLIGQEDGEYRAASDLGDGVRANAALDAVEIAPNDPIVGYFQSAGGAVEVDKLNLDSPAARALKAAGVKVAVPLVSQGDLIGTLNLGPRLSEQEYSTDDRRLLQDLAIQAAPSVRVAQLVQQQEGEARERERLEQELRVASVIQQTLLPESVPAVPGWEMSAHYQPTREVGGDFYDFLDLPDGKLGLVVGDVTDKGVPAALVMATTRAVLRAAAEGLASPGEVLRRVNEVLHPDIPPKMFVTCLYAILDPGRGTLRYANAGHELPYRWSDTGIDELRATGMPLGLMPGMTYEENETELLPGDFVLLYSDGLTEAHNAGREMFGCPRLRDLLVNGKTDRPPIEFLLNELSGFTGPGWEQEDDVTLVTLQRQKDGKGRNTARPMKSTGSREKQPENVSTTLAEFEVASEPGNERKAMEQVGEAVLDLGLPKDRFERLGTAVAEATMNAMEHGNQYDPDLPVSVTVTATDKELSVQITDHGGGADIPEAATPDLEAKLAGEQTPRGWGLFLIKEMVDDVRVTSDDVHHTVELVMYLQGDRDADDTA